MNETPSRRPMTFSFLELLDRTFRIYRENFLTIVGLVAMVTIPITLLTLFLNPATGSALSGQSGNLRTTSASGSQLLINILNLVETVLIYAPLTYIASEYLFNRKVSIGQAFSATSSRFFKMGCGIILLGIVISIFGVMGVLLVLAFPPALALAGILVYIVIACYGLIFQVLTLEDIGPSPAITRSFTLGKTRFWTIIGLGFIIGIITTILGSILTASAAVVAFSSASSSNLTGSVLLITFLGALISIFLTPITPIAFTLLYYDIRVRSEGLDIMLDSSGPDARPDSFSSPSGGFRMDGHDWRNIAILSVMGLLTGLVASNAIRVLVSQFSALGR